VENTIDDLPVGLSYYETKSCIDRNLIIAIIIAHVNLKNSIIGLLHPKNTNNTNNIANLVLNFHRI